MKIGLNATCLNDRASGAKQRFSGIYGELFRLLGDDEFIVYEPADCRISRWFDDAPNVRYRRTPLLSQSRLRKYLGGLLYWPSSLREEKTDIFEGFHLPLVKAPSGRTLLTIHDIRFMHARGPRRAAYEAILAQSLRAADHVITVSGSMRDEILGLYSDLPISVIYNGIDIDNFDAVPEDRLREARRNLGLPDEYLLAVGHFEKRKNYANLIEALARLHAKGSSLHLVIVGNDSGEMSPIRDRIHSLDLSKYVKILSGLTDLDVRCVYKLCRLFVFPSSYEGFGIPILEAMAAGRPMVLSDIPVFREITQGQGVYFPHGDPDSIAGAIDDVLYSKSECDRLIRYGSKRVEDFSFRRISADLARLYRSMS